MIKNVLKTLIIGSILTVSLNAQDDIDRLMKASGFEKIESSMIEYIKQMDPNIDAKEFKGFLDAYMGKVKPIFSKHYTKEEIKAMIKFYESDVGKKIIDKQPLIMREIMNVAQTTAMEFIDKKKK